MNKSLSEIFRGTLDRRLLVSAPRFLVVVTDEFRVIIGPPRPNCLHFKPGIPKLIKSFDGEQPVQDVLGRKAPEELCRGKETASTPPPSPSTKKVAMATVATAGDEPREVVEKSTNRTTKKGANSSSSRKACECPSAHQCQCPEAEFLLDGMSPPAGGRPPAAPPTQWPTSTDMESITEGQALPWWVLLLLAIAVLQTIAFVWLCCRLHARRRRQRNAMSSSGKVPLGSTDSCGAVLNTCSAPISAYSAASILINAKQSRMPAAPSIVEQYQQHNNNNNKNNSSTTTSGQWTLTSGSGSAASPSVSSNRSSTASSPVVGGGAFAIAGGMGPGLPRTAAMARSASFTGGGYARRSNYADGEISIRLDGVSACSTAMTLPPPTAAPVPPHHLAQLYHQQQLPRTVFIFSIFLQIVATKMPRSIACALVVFGTLFLMRRPPFSLFVPLNA
uniref:Uncharacterized protein n=1 Tax=Globodera rostochiensis TaxID=31243 RepID=A0A914HGF7_GLORO